MEDTMRRICLAVLLLAVSATIAHAQLTADQRVADFTQLANLYAKNYGPYEWKVNALKYDLLDLTPWLDRVRNATNDLDFQEVLIEYVASLNDAHDLVAFPTTFFVRLPFTVDIYDGKVLIDSISRPDMPVRRYPFTVGDQLVSVDGRAVQDLIQSFRKYAISANQRSTDRIAATRIVSRSQQIMPHASDVLDAASIVVQRSNGILETYSVPWI